MIEWIDDLQNYATRPAPLDSVYEYARLIEDLIYLTHIKEDSQFAIGEALQGVETRYQDCTIEGIAGEIGLSASSLYSYRELAETFTAPQRVHYRAQGLYFSHLREAHKMDTFEAVHDFLADCILNRWTTTQAAIEVRTRKGYAVQPPPVFHGPASFSMQAGRMVIDGLAGVQIEAGVRYDVIVRRAR